MSVGSGWFRRLFAEERRRDRRQHLPGLVAHYWDGASPRPRPVADISSTGSYMHTEDRWYPGTVFRVTLQSYRSSEPRKQNGDPNGGADSETLVVLAEIVRAGPDGVGLRFLFLEERDSKEQSLYPDCLTSRKTMMEFLKRAEGSHSPVTYSIKE